LFLKLAKGDLNMNIFMIASVVLALLFSVRMLFAIGAVACSSPDIFTAGDFLFGLGIFVAVWVLGFLSGKMED